MIFAIILASALVSYSTVSAQCADLLNPRTGVSDCPRNVGLCTNSIYLSLMRVQCPRTCGFCTVTGTTSVTTTRATTTVASTTCADRVNPSTGVSDCARNVGLCNNSIYRTLMVQQCPRTCGVCTVGR